jgi:hypothetical protein
MLIITISNFLHVSVIPALILSLWVGNLPDILLENENTVCLA